jgi:hypothetical protein
MCITIFDVKLAENKEFYLQEFACTLGQGLLFVSISLIANMFYKSTNNTCLLTFRK